MRITKVSVKKLFGIFDHEIPLNMDTRITIIHGPNGFGKTTLLSMIHGLFNAKLWVFYDTPFEEFSIETESGEKIIVSKELTSSDSNEANLTIFHDDGTEGEPAQYNLARRENYRQQIFNFAASVPELRHIGNDLWLNVATGAALTIVELVESFPDKHGELYGSQAQNWFKNLCSKISTRFAESQRLRGQIISAPFRDQYHSDRRPIPVLPDTTVERLSSDLVARIATEFKEYSDVSQQLDSSFLKRLVEMDSDTDFTPSEFKDDLERLAAERLEFVELGLLYRDDNELASEFTIEPHDFRAVSIHVHDRSAKQAVLHEIAKRLRKLLEIVNERFKLKRLIIDRDKGFVFVAHNGKEIPLERLSSGEQHELVLFYQLLFHVQENSLILIDEPELSLHVTWQRKFLNDLVDVVAMSEFDALIATHSPQIVHDRYDWMVDLHNPEDELTDDSIEYATV